MFKCSPVPASFFFCSSTTAAGSHWRSPPLPAARSPQHRDPTQQRGLSDSVSLLPPGFRHQCNEVDRYGKKEAGTGEHLNTFNNQINKHNRKAAAPHGRLPQTKHKLKSRPGPLSSSTVVTPPFIPSGAPPWDSRPVSGAGVVHYHSLHRPRSIPTALGPAPLVTGTHKGSPAVKQRKKNTQTEWVHKDNSTKQVSLLIADFLLFALLSLI